MRSIRRLPIVLAALAVAAAPGAAATTSDGFVEPVNVLSTLSGGSSGVYFGWAVSELGDVNGDGAMDVIVGEPYTATGTTYVYSGRTGALLRRLDGAPGDQQGYAIADAGDTDGDGVADVVSGAPGVGAGRAYLYSGRTGALLHTFAGERAGDFFGSAVAGAGDVDRDGRADVLVGAELSDAGGVDSGVAYVYSGRTFERLLTLDKGGRDHKLGSATDRTADVNRDGYPDLVVGARDAGAGAKGKAWIFSGRTGKVLEDVHPAGAALDVGWFFVAGVGDVNGDGTPDVYAADFGDTTLGPATGRAGVYSGRDGGELHAWTGSAAGAGLGPGREAGDVDGDGRPDLAVGSYTASDGAPGAGKIEIFSGRTGALLRRITSTTPGENLGFDAVGIGDVNGDGIPDLLASAATGERVYVIAGTRP